MRPPAFWSDPAARLLPRLLAPLAGITASVTARRISKPGWRAPVPVICCGNITVGGTGKTILALELVQQLQERGVDVHVLTRGYGGRVRGVLRVDPKQHDASLTGDEALLLAARAPVWVGADRAASARAATAEGAQILLLDDGMQNPGLAKDCTLLVVDGAAGFGNARCLPAGPLREPIAAGMARTQAVVLIGEDARNCLADMPREIEVLRAELVMGPEASALRGRRLYAFAGIGRPDKFFTSLTGLGLDLAGRQAFADHHPYSDADLQRLLARAERFGASLVTTSKDVVRIPSSYRNQVSNLSVGLNWSNHAQISRLVDKICDKAAANERFQTSF